MFNQKSGTEEISRVHNIDPDRKTRICSTLQGNSDCGKKRLSGRCRGSEGECRGYKILTTAKGVVMSRPLQPMEGATKDPIFPLRRLARQCSGMNTFSLARQEKIDTKELKCNRRCGSKACIKKISSGNCPTAENDRIRCRSKQGELQNVTDLLRQYCPMTPDLHAQLSGSDEPNIAIRSNN